MRPAFDALFAIDDALGDVVTSSSEPALGAIRLAWWREALERLDSSPPPPEPRLQAAASELLPRGISGQQLAGLEDGWAALFDEQPDLERAAERGSRLFAVGAKLLDVNDDRVEAAGKVYVCAQLRRKRLADVAPSAGDSTLRGHRFPRAVRPLTGLARLAARDVRHAPAIEAEATPARAAALLSHRLFGIVS